ncbi:MAG: beta-galactosidase [Epulopiscium sp. Nele67-Bin005]|nr:MAG: beta-galactosidase [Epulopiscium sp. Nele67-Bin005]
MYLGVDYYPEQWDLDMVDEDLDTILELGANTIRIGEFAWCRMEKEEGQFDFSLFDTVINQAKAKGLNVIFGTPTATLPAWLAKKHPEVLSEFENGQKRSFGGRRNYCFNSDIYKDYSTKIISALLTHYKEESAIVSWQTDNEFGHEGSDICYCSNCHNKFQKFLQNKYNTITNLNETYGTIFWSQEYTNFDEIPLPLSTIATHNPSLRMDWELFLSESIENYSKFQVDLIKEIIPNAEVLHDFSGGGLTKHFDFAKVAAPLDIVAYNNYPVWGGQKEPVPPHDIAFNLSFMRGLKQQNFMITEAIMGAQGHDITGYLPRPNQAKMWSYQAMAYGCNSLLYFRYRSATKGAEQFCYGILDADNVKRRKFYEVQSFFKDICQYENMLYTPIENEVCIITDYQSMAAFRIQQQSILLDYDQELKNLYKPFHKNNIGVDVIPSEADFSKYKLVIAPLMIVWNKKFQTRAKEYVKHGGHIVFTYRTAVKDVHNNLTFKKWLPTNYDDLIGGYIFETESLQEFDCIPLKGSEHFENTTATAGVFREFIEPTTATTLFTYNDQFYDTYSAITENHFGQGMSYYLGTSLVPEDLNKFVEYLLNKVNIQGITTPEGVECIKRLDSNGKIYKFLINHTDKLQHVLDDILEPYEVKILG